MENQNHGEYQYLDLCREIINNGKYRPNRTGIPTYSKFGTQMRFNLRESFPLLTTKRVFWKGVVAELLWLISGSTDSRILSDQDVKIWNANSSREFLDSCGFHDREVGDLGPVYGFQWRHFGAKYKDFHSNYHSDGVDQIKQVINLINTDPFSRRILFSAWNPVDIPIMALPPCHILCQFYVQDGELSSQLYQRSGDVGLGVPFNIASYSLLTYMLAHICGLKPGDFVHTIGDAHVYENHVEALKIQITREPFPFPKLTFARKIGDIDDFRLEDILLSEYKCHPAIKMEMAV